MQATKNVLRMSEGEKKKDCQRMHIVFLRLSPPPPPARACLFVCLFVHVDVYSQGKICVHRASKENGREASPKVG